MMKKLTVVASVLLALSNTVYAQEQVCKVTAWGWMQENSKIAIYGNTECYFTNQEDSLCVDCSRGRLRVKAYNQENTLIGYSSTYLDNRPFMIHMYNVPRSDALSIKAEID